MRHWMGRFYFLVFSLLVGQNSHSFEFPIGDQNRLEFESLNSVKGEVFIDQEVNLFDLWAYEKQYFDQYKTPEERRQAYLRANQTDLKTLQAYRPRLSSGRLSTLAPSVSLQEARELLQLAQFHPIASPYIVANWDPDGRIGFCFGRAMAVDLEARFRGLDRNSIGKAWVLGPMMLGTSEWGWHVTSIVFSDELGWVTIDPIFNDIVPIADWAENMWQANEEAKLAKKNSKDPHHLRIYFTKSGRFGPSGLHGSALGRHMQDQIKSDFYNGYFNALIGFTQKISQIARILLNSTDLDEATREFYRRKPGQLRPSSFAFLALDPDYMEEAIAPLREVYGDLAGSEEGVEYEVPTPRSPRP